MPLAHSTAGLLQAVIPQQYHLSSAVYFGCFTIQSLVHVWMFMDCRERKCCCIFRSDCPLCWQGDTICTDTKWSFSQFNRFLPEICCYELQACGLMVKLLIATTQVLGVLCILSPYVRRRGKCRPGQVNSSCSSCFSSQKRNWRAESMLTSAECFWFCFSLLWKSMFTEI